MAGPGPYAQAALLGLTPRPLPVHGTKLGQQTHKNGSCPTGVSQADFFKFPPSQSPVRMDLAFDIIKSLLLSKNRGPCFTS